MVQNQDSIEQYTAWLARENSLDEVEIHNRRWLPYGALLEYLFSMTSLAKTGSKKRMLWSVHGQYGMARGRSAQSST